MMDAMNPYSAPWRRSTRWRRSNFNGNSLAEIHDFRSTTRPGLRDGGRGFDSGSGDPDATELSAAASVVASDGPIDRGLARCRVEALLLIAKTPLNYRRLSALAGLEDATQARTLVNELNELYDCRGRGIRIEQIAGGCRMMTRSVVSPWLRRLGVLPPAIRLSWPMMETLAIVAYRQDVTRADVEAVRGVACGEILRQLMSLDLVRISGRSDELGRPYLYGTTKRFLQICGLASINSLPAIDSRGFCDDVSGSPELGHSQVADSRDPNQPSPRLEPDVDAGSSVSKESDVSLVLTDALATDSVLSTIAVAGDASAAPVASPFVISAEYSVDPDQSAEPFGADDEPSGGVAVIEDEEDDLYENGVETDDDEEFVDDEDDWDDDDDDKDDAEDDVEDEDDDEDDVEDEDDSDDSWEEVDDAEADEDWEDDDEEDDWDEEDDEEEDEEEEEWEG